jgi:hypothetical protein
LTFEGTGWDWKFETFGHSAEPGGRSGLFVDMADKEAIEWIEDEELWRWTLGLS